MFSLVFTIHCSGWTGLKVNFTKCKEENGPTAWSWPLFLLFLWRSSSWLVALLVPVVWCCSGIRLQKPLFCSRSVTQQMWSDGRSGDGKRFHLASLRTSIVLKGQVHAPRWSSQTITIPVTFSKEVSARPAGKNTTCSPPFCYHLWSLNIFCDALKTSYLIRETTEVLNK